MCCDTRCSVRAELRIRMSFLNTLARALAGKVEQKATKALVESQTFKRIVHTVEREGIKGVQEHVKKTRAGVFASAFFDELKTDLGLKQADKKKQEEKTKLLQKRH